MEQRRMPRNTEELEMLTAEEVMQLLKIGRTTLYRLIKDEKLPCYKLGRATRFKKTDIARFLEEHKKG